MKKKEFANDDGDEKNVIQIMAKTQAGIRGDEKTAAVLKSMTDDFDIVAYIDYESGEILQYRMEEEFLEISNKLEGAMTRVGKLYANLHKVVYKEDVEYVLDMVKKEKVLEELSHSKTYMFDCRVMKGGIPTYYRIKYARVPDNDKAVVIGLQNIDAQVRKEIEYRKDAQFRENARRVMELSENFECIYDVNIDTGEYIITNSEGLNRGFFPTQGENQNVAFNIGKIGKMSSIVEEDRPKILALMNPSLVKRLEKEGMLTVDYRRIVDGKVVWYRLRITESGDWTKERRVLVGIFNNDRNMREQEERLKFQEICNALSYSFESLYYVNTIDDTYIEYNTKDDFVTNQLDLDGKNFFEASRENTKKVAYPDDIEKMRDFFKKENILQDLSGKDTVSLEYRLMVDEKPVYYRARAINAGADKNHIVIAVENIESEVSGRMLYQRQLEDALRMAQSSNRAKTVFLNNMSHDIRTPMNAIIGFTGLANSHIDEKEKVRDYLNKIEQSSDHLLALINDVLDMSRIESGKVKVVEKEENLVRMMNILKDIVFSDIQSKMMDFSVDMTGVKDETVTCDRLRINQVLINTLSNAIKYTPKGGKINLKITQGDEIKDGYAQYNFIVKDNGIGMNDNFLKTIFEPFTRENTSTVSGIQGTGLGMTITKKTVDMMGGTIDVKSRENEGTVVTISLPLKVQAQNNQISQSDGILLKKTESKISAKEIKILLVEDNELNREIAMELLKDAGFEVGSVNDGIYAVDTMKKSVKGDWNLILMDIQMPIMNGYEATRQIRALPSVYAQNIPIIAMTANAFEDDKKTALEAGMNGHIAKPIDMGSFIENLSKYLGVEIE